MRCTMRRLLTSTRSQLRLAGEGPLESEVLRSAAAALVQRHANLRTAFRHEQLSRPVQVVRVVGAGAVPQHRSVDAGRGRARGALGTARCSKIAPNGLI